MIPLTFFYDEYIDRPKLTEQKNPFEYIVPLPHKWGRNKKNCRHEKSLLFNYTEATLFFEQNKRMKCQLLLKVDQNWTEGDKNEDFSIFLNIFLCDPFLHWTKLNQISNN